MRRAFGAHSPRSSPSSPKRRGSELGPSAGASVGADVRPWPVRSGSAREDLAPGPLSRVASRVVSRVNSINSNIGKEQAVAVVCHVRPLLPAEVVDGCAELLSCDQATAQVAVGFTLHHNKQMAFAFDAVYGACGGAAPSRMYGDHVAPLVDSLFQGINGTVFAYGQTCSGKSFTMGTDLDTARQVDGGRVSQESERNAAWMPITQRAIADIAQRCDALRAGGAAVELRCSFFEIYQDTIRDLLATPCRVGGGRAAAAATISVRDPDPRREVLLVGLEEVKVSGIAALQQCLLDGVRARATSATGANTTSSRSHAVLRIHLRTVTHSGAAAGGSAVPSDSGSVRTSAQMSGPLSPRDGSGVYGGTVLEEVLSAKLYLVDLAGSERQSRSGAEGQRLDEACSINQGLLALGNVIEALSDVKRRHVPYRDHVLTRVLRHALGGNSRTLMVACVSPADVAANESLNTLRYASRARAIKNVPTVNSVQSGGGVVEAAALRLEILELRAMVDALQAENVQMSSKSAAALTGANSSAAAAAAAMAAAAGMVSGDDLQAAMEEAASERRRAEEAEAHRALLTTKLKDALFENKRLTGELDDVRRLAAAQLDEEAALLSMPPMTLYRTAVPASHSGMGAGGEDHMSDVLSGDSHTVCSGSNMGVDPSDEALGSLLGMTDMALGDEEAAMLNSFVRTLSASRSRELPAPSNGGEGTAVQAAVGHEADDAAAAAASGASGGGAPLTMWGRDVTPSAQSAGLLPTLAEICPLPEALDQEMARSRLSKLALDSADDSALPLTLASVAAAAVKRDAAALLGSGGSAGSTGPALVEASYSLPVRALPTREVTVRPRVPTLNLPSPQAGPPSAPQLPLLSPRKSIGSPCTLLSSPRALHPAAAHPHGSEGADSGPEAAAARSPRRQHTTFGLGGPDADLVAAAACVGAHSHSHPRRLRTAELLRKGSSLLVALGDPSSGSSHASVPASLRRSMSQQLLMLTASSGGVVDATGMMAQLRLRPLRSASASVVGTAVLHDVTCEVVKQRVQALYREHRLSVLERKRDEAAAARRRLLELQGSELQLQGGEAVAAARSADGSMSAPLPSAGEAMALSRLSELASIAELDNSDASVSPRAQVERWLRLQTQGCEVYVMMEAAQEARRDVVCQLAELEATRAASKLCEAGDTHIQVPSTATEGDASEVASPSLALHGSMDDSSISVQTRRLELQKRLDRHNHAIADLLVLQLRCQDAAEQVAWVAAGISTTEGCVGAPALVHNALRAAAALRRDQQELIARSVAAEESSAFKSRLVALYDADLADVAARLEQVQARMQTLESVNVKLQVLAAQRSEAVVRMVAAKLAQADAEEAARAAQDIVERLTARRDLGTLLQAGFSEGGGGRGGMRHAPHGAGGAPASPGASSGASSPRAGNATWGDRMRRLSIPFTGR